MSYPEYVFRNGKRYLAWSWAGGPNECKHGYAAGVPCPDCDEEVTPPKPLEPPQEIERNEYEGLRNFLDSKANREPKPAPQVEQSFEAWWKSTYEKELKRQGVGGLARIIHMNGAREGWNAAKAEGK